MEIEMELSVSQFVIKIIELVKTSNDNSKHIFRSCTANLARDRFIYKNSNK